MFCVLLCVGLTDGEAGAGDGGFDTAPASTDGDDGVVTILPHFGHFTCRTSRPGGIVSI